MFVLTDNSQYPYEGGSTSVMGVFSTRENALDHMRYLLTTENYKYNTEQLRNTFVDGIPIPDEYSTTQYTYYSEYDHMWFEILEHELDKPSE